MSKLYEKYLAKKAENAAKKYLFKSGNFYIFLAEDAKLMGDELGLKLTKFSNESDKCGFPVSELDKYLKFVKLLKYDLEIVLNTVDYIIDDILKTTNITKDGAFLKIKKYRELLLDDK